MTDPAHLESLIIFPLRDVVLFPDTQLPLHIFEPRYRAMLRDAIEQKRPVAMATHAASMEVDNYDRPLVRPYMGVGEVQEWEELPDGRFLVVLDGVQRVRIVDEYAPERPYRIVRAVEVPDEPGDEADTAASVTAIRGLIRTMQSHNPRLASFVGEELEKHPEPAVFSNRLAAMLSGDTDSQYRMLETIRVSDRMSAIVERLSDILARMTVAPGGGALN